jgi:hypothetical protein
LATVVLAPGTSNEVAPLLPKLVSIAPMAVIRARSARWIELGSPPARTILPSDWIASALAAGEPPPGVAIVVLPPVPRPLSGVPVVL